jgi:ABC-2 type transport system ATP-binding protein
MGKKELLLNVSHLGKSYGEKVVLRDINLSVERGEIVGLLGVNGAGKTTLMSCIAGTIPFSKGDIQFCGKDLMKNLYELHKMGFLIKARFLEYLTAEENLMVLGAYAGLSIRELDKLVPAALKTVQLYEKRNDCTAGFSFGQLQRLGVAQAILGEKELLILDEPFVGLDSEGKQMLEQVILHKSRQEGTAVILSSHDMEEIKKVCDRIVILKDGVVVFNDKLEVTKTAYIQLKPESEKAAVYQDILFWEEKVTLGKDGMLEVTDENLLGEVLNQLGKDDLIAGLYIKETSVQEIFNKVTREVV